MFLENDLFEDNGNISVKERDMHMFDLKNHMVSIVEEKTYEKDTVCEMVSNGNSSKKYATIFRKDDNLYWIGFEREFYVEYIMCGRKKLDVRYIAIAKEKGIEGDEFTYVDCPEKIFSSSLRFLSTLCEKE